MASPYDVHLTFQGSPLYIFYDCESTGCDPKNERIIEVAAVLHTKSIPSLSAHQLDELTEDNRGSFTSLCHCTKPIDPESAKILTLTLDDLKNEPPLHTVLDRFFDWIREKLTQVSGMTRSTFTPVLVAHSGTRLDFPILVNEVERIGTHLLRIKFEGLNLHYVDSYTHFTQEWKNDAMYKDRLSESMSLKAIYSKFIREEIKGHRALEDAQALCRVFTDGYPSCKVPKLRGIILNQRGLTLKEEQVSKMYTVGIKPKKAEEILLSGLTIEMIEDRCRRNPDGIRSELRRLGITRPSRPLLEHFENLSKW